MAKQLYDYWFVQFDFPDENGKPYKSSGGKMVWDDKLKCEVPEGWNITPLGNIVLSYQQGLIRSNKELSNNADYCYLKMGDLDGKGGYTSLNIAKTSATNREVSQYKLAKGDLLINVRNSREIVGKTCIIDYVKETTLFNHMLVRITFSEGVSAYYMNILFNTPYMLKILDGCKQGTTTVIALYQDDLYRILVVVPEYSIMQSFNIKVQSILKQKTALNQEIMELTELRDFLLPLLMNGQVSVNYDLSHG